MYEHMLIPLDGSETAEEVLPYVAELAKRCGSRVTLLQAVESVGQAISTVTPAEPMMLSPRTVESVVEGVESLEEAGRLYLTRVAEQLQRDGLSAEREVVSGRAGEAILRFAEAHGADLIAIGSHGHGGIERAVFGSVADHVVRHARMPVLVVRHRQDGH